MPVTVDLEVAASYVDLYRTGYGAITVTPATLAREIADADVRPVLAPAATIVAADDAQLRHAFARPTWAPAADDAVPTPEQLAAALVFYAALDVVHEVLAIEGLAVKVRPAPVAPRHLTA